MHFIDENKFYLVRYLTLTLGRSYGTPSQTPPSLRFGTDTATYSDLVVEKSSIDFPYCAFGVPKI